MRTYIGCKIVRAEKMDEGTFLQTFREGTPGRPAGRPGYHVTYPDGYESWSPRDAFELAYREVDDAEIALIEWAE